MSTPDLSTPASRLCAACGMCCNGVMFDIVRLQPGDSPKRLSALGLKVKRKRGQSHFVQPCAAHQDSQCSIYAERPQRCRIFECRQLQRVAAGEITEVAALEKIGGALRLIADINALLLCAGDTNARHALSKRCETAMDEPTSDAAALELRRRLAGAKRELDTLLDQEFRVVPLVRQP
jgi:Fe-S-cluster containining protein